MRKTGNRITQGHQSSIQRIDDHIARWLSVTLLVVPLLLRAKIISMVSPVIMDGALNTGNQADLFTYYKWIFLILFILVILGLFLYKQMKYQYQIKQNAVNIPVLLFCGILWLATLTADYAEISLIGMFNRHEGMITYFCYLLLFFIGANIVFSERFMPYVYGVLSFFVVVSFLSCGLHFYGIDMLNWPLIRGMVIAPDLQNQLTGYIFSTLNHPNYVSGIAGALTAMFTTAAILHSHQKRWLGYAAVAILSFALVLVSLSISGFVALLMALPFMIVIVLRNYRGLMTIVASLVLIVSFAGGFVLLNSHNDQVMKENIGGLKSILEFGARQASETLTPIAWAAPQNEEKIRSELEQKFDLPEPGWSPGTGRTYIWSKTWELVKEKPWLGYGLDTFVYYFPQNDRDMIANLNNYTTIVDKAHNYYLAMAFGGGILSLLALLALLAVHLYSTVVNLWHRRLKNQAFAEVLFMFWVTFLFQWLFNDSIIGTGAIFWILFGIAASLNNQKKPEAVPQASGKNHVSKGK